MVSITDKGVLESPTVIVVSPISPSTSIGYLFLFYGGKVSIW